MGVVGVLAAVAMTFASAARAQEAKAEAKLEPKTEVKAPAKLTDVVLAAYNREARARSEFNAFAAKADEEGYKSVGPLFRALAKSEGMHADRHLAALKKLGVAVPEADEKILVKTTKENLEAAAKALTEAKDKVYPELVKQAEALGKEMDPGMLMGLKGAAAIADSNAKLCELAQKGLDGWKAAGKEVLLCTVCGYVSMDPKIEKCPICAAPRSKFETVK